VFTLVKTAGQEKFSGLALRNMLRQLALAKKLPSRGAKSKGANRFLGAPGHCTYNGGTSNGQANRTLGVAGRPSNGVAQSEKLSWEDPYIKGHKGPDGLLVLARQRPWQEGAPVWASGNSSISLQVAAPWQGMGDGLDW